MNDPATTLPRGDMDLVAARIAGGESAFAGDHPAVDSAPASRVNGARVLERTVPPLVAFLLVTSLWEYLVPAVGINSNTLPTPSQIWATFISVHAVVIDDGWATFSTEAVRGYVVGSIVGFSGAVVAWRFSAVARGLLPYAVVSNSIPIVAMAPVAIVLFGFDWQSKAVICGVMCIFPMFVNTIRGLRSVDPLSNDLMSSYGAGKWTGFLKLRLPAALPFIFNGLKINTTLAMIGAIVGEFFGSASQGLGIYIDNQSGINNYVETWAAVIVACVIGIAFYLVVLLIERRVTSWHVSYRTVG